MEESLREIEQWDCSQSQYPDNSNSNTCWADEAYQECAGGQWAYDAVMQVGGSNKGAYDLLQDLKDGYCDMCDASKASCKNSIYPENTNTCWGDQAYQRCPNARQQAYDLVMKAGGSTPLAYCTLEGLIMSDCAVFDVTEEEKDEEEEKDCKDMQCLFEKADTDKSGKLDQEEISKFVDHLVANEPAVTQDIGDYIIDLTEDIGGEDGVDFQEFAEI